MENIQEFLDKIPIRHNLASYIMLVGVVQTLFLVIVIFLKSKRGSAAMLFGWALLMQGLVFTDTYLCYTGLIKHALHINDSTEVFVLMIAPMLYLFIYALLKREIMGWKKILPHFALPLLYGISQIGYYLAPIPIKLNAYLGAYYDHLGYAETPEHFNYSYMFIKDEFRWIILLSFAFYMLITLRLAIKAYQNKSLVVKSIKMDKYTFSITTAVLFTILLLFLFLIYVNFDDDRGDHFIGIFHTVIIFLTAYFLLAESRFFEKSWVADKYETFTSNSLRFETIEKFLKQDNFYLSKKITLKSVAEQLNTSPNLVSKVINSDTGLNFNDYINQKRIAISQLRLMDPSYAALTVEAIGETVGFTSKSTFYNAFKKHTGTTPSSYIKSNSAE